MDLKQPAKAALPLDTCSRYFPYRLLDTHTAASSAQAYV